MTIPMDLPLGEQCVQFLWAVLTGGAMGLLYALCRHFGRRGHGFFWDLLFTTLALALGIACFLLVCRGWPRLYHLFGIALGAWSIRRILRQVSRHHRSTHE